MIRGLFISLSCRGTHLDTKDVLPTSILVNVRIADVCLFGILVLDPWSQGMLRRRAIMI